MKKFKCALTSVYRKHLENMIRKVGIDPKTVDLDALWDTSLTYQENKENIKRLIGKSTELENLYQKDEVENYVKMTLEEERIHIQEQIKKEFEKILKTETSNLKIFFFPLEKYIETVLKTKHIHSLFIIGKAGLGKSVTTIKTLTRLNKDFKAILGNISPLELYHTLYEWRNGVLVFDDTQGLLNNKASMSLLMSATWNPTNRRIVSWLTTSKKLKAPPQFEFKGKIIFIANEIPKNIEPTVSRCLKYELNFNYYEILKIMAEISKLPHPNLSKEERLMIFNWIKNNCDETTENFDLRLQKKIETLYEHNKKEWKKLALKLIKKDEDLAVIKQLMEESRIVKTQVKKWVEITGKSRRTFFLKKRLLKVQ